MIPLLPRLNRTLLIGAHRIATLVLATSLVSGLSGCGGSYNPLDGGTDPAGPPSFTGNWQFTGVPPGPGQPTAPVSLFVGALASSGSNITGTFRLVSTTGCIPPTQDVTFTGSQDKYSFATLTSTNLPANPIILTLLGATLPGGSGVGFGSYTIGGSGPCAMAKTNFGSLLFQPLTGTYAGTLTSTATPAAAVAATVTATLAQAAADADGQFPESGTITLVTPTCTSTFAVTGLVTGPTFSASLNQTTVGIESTALVLGAIPPDASQIAIPTGINVASAKCNAGSFSGTLKKQ